MKEQRVIYYTDPLRDDFAGTKIDTGELTADFVYIRRNLLWRAASFILYYFLALPLVFIFCKLAFGLRIKNRKALRGVRKQGFFLYGNHTGFYDAFTHNLVCFPKRMHVIAHRDAVSIKGIRQLVMLLGALPIPTTVQALKNMIAAIEYRYRQRRGIAIYPEAHIWPYYTGLRPFTDVSFHYPVKLGAPSLAMVTTYRKPRFGKRPRITIFLSEPFYPDYRLEAKEAQRDLRDRIHRWMDECLASHENYEYIRYVQKENGNQ
jgi:1-acyl-sn-glycerol-3-phosphate acyltransferase